MLRLVYYTIFHSFRVILHNSAKKGTLKKILIFLIFITSALACSDSSVQTNVPNVAVDEYIYLNNASSYNLRFVGGWIYHSGGNKGLIIYRRYFNGDGNDFGAYDRTCPNHPYESCGKLTVSGDYAKCGCDDQQFLLFDGTPLNGSTTYPLRAYDVTFDGINVIHVSN